MKHHTEKGYSKIIKIVTATSRESDSGYRRCLGSKVTDGALPVPLAITSEDNLLTGIEARLAEEVSDLASALRKFGIRTQSISEELPLSSEFGKLITSFFSAGSLQLANALLQGKDKPLLLDDGAMQLHELGLSLNDFIREVTLEGRQFLAVALIKKRFPDSTDGSETGE